MSLTITEALRLNHLKQFKLLAGQLGLSKSIDKIGILDYEIIEGIEGNFSYGDFVLTTFTPIRHDTNAIETCIRELIDCHVTALAIKSTYVDSISEDIITYANEQEFPIFLFSQDIYYEDIIEDLIKGMTSRGHIEILESKIDVLFSNDLKPHVVEELAFDLNSRFHHNHQVFYLREKKYINDDNIIKIAERYKRSRHQNMEHSVFKYQDGLLIIMTYQSMETKHVTIDLGYIFNHLAINQDHFYMGCSNVWEDIGVLDKSIKESIFANRVCELEDKQTLEYNAIGIYKLLLPGKNPWMRYYVSDTLDPIYGYDDGKLIETARTYIKYKGDIIKTSNVMFQHKNTIRYRIQKMKSLLHLESDGDFYEQLSIAIKCEKLIY